MARSDLPFTACSVAQPTVHQGQLCYSINVTNISGNMTTKTGKRNSLLLLLDTGADKSAKVSVHTLSEFSSYVNGTTSFLAMSDLKNMAASKQFMDFPDTVKKCQSEELEKCHMKNFFKNIEQKCQCVPWQLATFRTSGLNITSKVG